MNEILSLNTSFLKLDEKFIRLFYKRYKHIYTIIFIPI